MYSKVLLQRKRVKNFKRVKISLLHVSTLFSHGSYHNLPGLAGCVKGLVYNGKLRNLTYDVYDE